MISESYQRNPQTLFGQFDHIDSTSYDSHVRKMAAKVTRFSELVGDSISTKLLVKV